MTLTSLRRARLELGLTQLDVSLKAGITPSRLSIIERAIVQPTDHERDRLNAVLDLTIDPNPVQRAPDAPEETR